MRERDREYSFGGQQPVSGRFLHSYCGLGGSSGSSAPEKRALLALVRPILGGTAQLAKYGDWFRIALVFPFVLVCYQLEWSTWRSEVCGAFVAFSHLLGIPVLRISPDSLLCQGQAYRFVISCTAIDAFFGSVPLLWVWGKPIFRNLLFFGLYFLLLSLVNLIRLAAGLWIFLRGVPWWLSHEALAGVFYFGLFLWIAHRRGWVPNALPKTA